MEKLTFKQYLNSKTKLLEAIEESPIYTATYTVSKYCKLPVGESKDLKEYIHLKPKHQIVVEWDYGNPDDPQALTIKFDKVVDLDREKAYNPLWISERLEKWLTKNARKTL